MQDSPTRPAPAQEVVDDEATSTSRIPQYHVVLLDDDDHTYEYVIEMLQELFGHDARTSFDMASEVDRRGRVIVFTTHREQAEFKRDQIHGYGPDVRIAHCAGSMSALVEPAE